MSLMDRAKGAARGAVQAAQERRDERATATAAEEARSRELRQRLLEAGELYEYGVVEIRESIIGDKFSGPKLQALLNEWAAKGWRLKTMTKAAVAGRVGPGGVDGLVLVFERQARN